MLYGTPHLGVDVLLAVWFGCLGIDPVLIQQASPLIFEALPECDFKVSYLPPDRGGSNHLLSAFTSLYRPSDLLNQSFNTAASAGWFLRATYWSGRMR